MLTISPELWIPCASGAGIGPMDLTVPGWYLGFAFDHHLAFPLFDTFELLRLDRTSHGCLYNRFRRSRL